MEKLGGQGSIEWMMQRVGRVTASRFKDVTGTKAKREAYLFEHVVERLTNQPTDHYVSKPMLDGQEREPFARMKYEAATGAIVEEVGFLPHPDLPLVGGSPDGLIGSDGIVEIKAPTAPTHLRTLLDGMSGDHLPQVQGVLWITGRKWADFISYYPDLPPPLDLHIQRIERDEDYIKALAEDVAKFLADADMLLARLKPPVREAPPSTDSGQPQEVDAPAAVDAQPADEFITPDQCADLEAMCSEFGIQIAALKKAAKVERLALLKAADYARALAWVRKHKEAARQQPSSRPSGAGNDLPRM